MRTNEKSRRIEPEMIVAVAAVFVGICALAVSLYQASIMREQQRELSEQRRAEVWPNLEFGRSQSAQSFTFLLLNTGIGPAKIGPIQFTLDGEPISHWEQLLNRVAPSIKSNYGQSQIGGRVLPAGEHIEALLLEGDIADSLRFSEKELIATFCYCSIYNDCWEYVENLRGNGSRSSVTECVPEETDFLQ